jgi:hypothetical protein
MPDIGAAQAEEDRLAAEHEAQRCAEEEEEEAQRRAEEEEAEARRLAAAEEEDRRQRAEAELQQRLVEEERLREEQEAREREAHRQRVEAECRAEALRAEEERKCQIQERKDVVAIFLKEHKFKDVTAPKSSFGSKTYPVHLAAKLGNQQMVQMLLLEGADPLQKDSAGKTPLQVAQKKARDGSHLGVVRVLGGA